MNTKNFKMGSYQGDNIRHKQLVFDWLIFGAIFSEKYSTGCCLNC